MSTPIDTPIDMYNLVVRWRRTYVRQCPVSKLEVTFEDVLSGKYVLPRINGDSALGYEVYPSQKHLEHMREALPSL